MFMVGWNNLLVFFEIFNCDFGTLAIDISENPISNSYSAPVKEAHSVSYEIFPFISPKYHTLGITMKSYEHFLKIFFNERIFKILIKYYISHKRKKGMNSWAKESISNLTMILCNVWNFNVNHHQKLNI